MTFDEINKRLNTLSFRGPLQAFTVKCDATPTTDDMGNPCAEIHIRVWHEGNLVLDFIPRWTQRPLAEFDNEAKLNALLATIGFDAMGRLVYMNLLINEQATIADALRYL
jgi:hypothetical protein